MFTKPNRLYTEAKLAIHPCSGFAGPDGSRPLLFSRPRSGGRRRGAGIQELRIVVARDSNYLPRGVCVGETLFKSGHEEEAEKCTKDPRQRAESTPGLDRTGSACVAAAATTRPRSPVSRKLLEAHSNATSGAALLAEIMTRQGNTDRAEALATWSLQKRILSRKIPG